MRGKYAAHYRVGTNLVLLEPEVAKAFPNDKTVNEALKLVIKLKHVQEVVKRALELSASAIILVHNHPSGDPTPSRADIDMTRQIVEAAKPLGIAIHDHVIVGRQGHASLKALKLL